MFLCWRITAAFFRGKPFNRGDPLRPAESDELPVPGSGGTFPREDGGKAENQREK